MIISVHCDVCSVIKFAILDLYLQLILYIKASFMNAGLCLLLRGIVTLSARRIELGVKQFWRIIP
jgi:hypothetical protein